ncbi:hypothetical protein C0674_15420 [Sporolactobacillus terrae]|uniref:Uncharacterized protein n=1 Tax=Sporolactobacillus terrae TaxID=269673 RepID=A0ABX5QB27_9BACL|nr:hypothetical protein C0674_15420 [Sporolactobacillus terrae]QAA26838.1 hypothetical protein C0679_15405 [Sporolactobacillus terrae]
MLKQGILLINCTLMAITRPINCPLIAVLSYMAFGNTVAEIHWKNELMHVILFEDNVFQKNRLLLLRFGIISF